MGQRCTQGWRQPHQVHEPGRDQNAEYARGRIFTGNLHGEAYRLDVQPWVEKGQAAHAGVGDVSKVGSQFLTLKRRGDWRFRRRH